MKITDSQFHKAARLLKRYVPYNCFSFNEEVKRPIQNGVNGSDCDFVEIAVETLFDIIVDFQKKEESLLLEIEAIKQQRNNIAKEERNKLLLQFAEMEGKTLGKELDLNYYFKLF